MKRFKLIAFIMIVGVLISISLSGLAFGNPLNVEFKSQRLEDGKGNNNCGPTSALMVMCYYNKIKPTDNGIRHINEWLACNINRIDPAFPVENPKDPKDDITNLKNHKGAYSIEPEHLVALAEEYGCFLDANHYSGWKWDDFCGSINQGIPVIVLLNVESLEQYKHFQPFNHYVVMIGYDDNYAFCMDPFFLEGNQEQPMKYKKDEFLKAIEPEEHIIKKTGESKLCRYPNSGYLPYEGSQVVVISPEKSCEANCQIFLDEEFNDPHYPYREAIMELYKEGVIEGYPDGSFRPDTPVNRAEFAKMVVKTAEKVDIKFEQDYNILSNFLKKFKDIPKEDIWYKEYIGKLATKQVILNQRFYEFVIEGYDDGNFGPEKYINMPEMLKIVVQTFFPVNPLKPDPKKNEWYIPYLNKATELIKPLLNDNNELISINSLHFYDSNTKSERYVTRKEAAQALYDAYKAYERGIR